MYEPIENEQLFHITPIGVRYTCPFCNKGEMKLDINNPARMPNMFPHKCTACDKTMQLPKTYPYIEWEEITPGGTDNETS